MTKRCIAMLCWLLVLVLSIPVLAQEGVEPEGEDELPPEPPAAPPPTDEELKTTKKDVSPTAPVLTTGPSQKVAQETWKDIVVVPRKPFLKRGRVELIPYYATTVNDSLIQHNAIGLEINYYLTDILSVGLQAHYYFKNILDQEFYTRYHFKRVPSLNKYIYTATLNMAYVPIYGKFSVFNKWIWHYEVFMEAGVGISGTEIIPRHYQYPSWVNPTTLTIGPVGMGGKLFVTRWLAVQATFRWYFMLDKFEPSNRTENIEADKAAATTSLVTNLMFSAGACIYFPMDFKYTTFR